MTLQEERIAEFISTWRDNIRVAQEYQKRFSKRDKFSEYREMYRGNWDESIYPVNRIFSIGRSMTPAIYFRSPRVSVTATHPDMVLHARVVEAVDNWLIDQLKLKYTLKRAILMAYHSGYCPIKLGYDSQYGYDPEQAVDLNYSTLTQEARSDARTIEYDTTIKPGMPWAIEEFPENVVIPYGYRHHNAPWIAHRILRPLIDVQEDQKYPKTKTKNLTGTRSFNLESPARKSQQNFDKDNVVYVELWEVRDRSTRMIYVFCENELLLSDYDALQIDNLPWEFLIFNEDPEYYFGISDVGMIEPQQKELIEIRTQASKHRKIALLKFLYLKGAIKEGELEKFFSGEVGPGIGVDGDSLAAAISMLQPHVPPDLMNEAIQVTQDMRETIGFSENELGAYKGGTPPSAAEAVKVSGSKDNRIDERKDIVADVMVEIIKKWNQYIFSFWTGERVIEIAGPDGAQQWIQYTGDQLKGNYNLHIDPDSGMPVTKQVKMEAAGELFKTFGGDQQVDQTKLRQLVLGEFEWIFPGVTGLLNAVMPNAISNMLAVSRQPNPMGSGAGLKGNRGGGQRPVQSLEDMSKQMKPSKGAGNANV